MLEKIQEIIAKNNFNEWDLENPILLARITLAAYGCQYDGKYGKTFGLYQDDKLVAKVNLPKPADNPWFVVGYLYESPRIANVAGFTVNFETGEFQGNLKELGLSDSREWNLSYDYKVKFDSVKILSGAEALKGKKVEAYA